MKKLFFLILPVTLLFLAQTIFACTMGKGPSAYNDAEYVFFGEIVGFTAPVESDKLEGEAVGLIVKVKESVYLPKEPKTYFEIFPIELRSDCSERGASLEELKGRFPFGAEIRVISREASLLPTNESGERIRLENRPDDFGSSLALNGNGRGDRMSTADSVFDYRTFKYTAAADSRWPFSFGGGGGGR